MSIRSIDPQSLHWTSEYIHPGSRGDGDGEFNSLDRSDETEATSESGTSYDIDPDLFPACDYFGDPGLMCGTEVWDCLKSDNWCVDSFEEQMCEGGVNTQDRRLCGNPLVFENISCFMFKSDGRVSTYGERCTGTNQQCIYPWYSDQMQDSGRGVYFRQ